MAKDCRRAEEQVGMKEKWELEKWELDNNTNNRYNSKCANIGWDKSRKASFLIKNTLKILSV